jgi:hypothetical protein
MSEAKEQKDESDLSALLCDGCKFEIKKPYGVPFKCVDGSTYCAGCFVDRSMANFIESNEVAH